MQRFSGWNLRFSVLWAAISKVASGTRAAYSINPSLVVGYLNWLRRKWGGQDVGSCRKLSPTGRRLVQGRFLAATGLADLDV